MNANVTVFPLIACETEQRFPSAMHSDVSILSMILLKESSKYTILIMILIAKWSETSKREKIKKSKLSSNTNSSLARTGPCLLLKGKKSKLSKLKITHCYPA
jgi:hypothetical protein